MFCWMVPHTKLQSRLCAFHEHSHCFRHPPSGHRVQTAQFFDLLPPPRSPWIAIHTTDRVRPWQFVPMSSCQRSTSFGERLCVQIVMAADIHRVPAKQQNPHASENGSNIVLPQISWPRTSITRHFPPHRTTHDICAVNKSRAAELTMPTHSFAHMPTHQQASLLVRGIAISRKHNHIHTDTS